jgi:ABC-type nitrate/sulfonate/bicarbonate transport system substrate-binding protein
MSSRASRLRGVSCASLAALLLTAGLSACGASEESADGATSITFQFDWVKSSEWAGFYQADAEGYYADKGLKVDFASGSNVANPAAVIAGGGAEMGFLSNDASLYDANKAGADLVAVGTVFQTSPAAIMTLPDRDISSVDDLKGLRIGTDAPGKADINALFQANGEDPDWTFVPTGFDAGPLFKGVVDAYYCYIISQPIAYELKGKPSNAVTFSDLGFTSHAELIVTTRSFLKDHEQEVSDFLVATQKGWDDTLADPEGGVHLTLSDYGKDLGLDAESELAGLKAQLPLMQSDFTDAHGLLALDPDEIAGPISDALKATGRDDLADLSDSYDTSLLSDVKAQP